MVPDARLLVVELLLEDNLEICKIGGDRIWVAHVELVDAHQHVSMYAMVRVWAHALIRALRDVLLMHVCDHVQRAQQHVQIIVALDVNPVQIIVALDALEYARVAVLDALDAQIHVHHLVLMHAEQTVFLYVREHVLHRVHLVA